MLTDRHALGVNDIHLRRPIGLRGGRDSALMRTGQFARKRQNHHIVARLLGAGDRLRESIRIDLAGRRELIALDEQLVKTLAREVYVGTVGRVTKSNGKRQDVEIRMFARQAIGTGIGDNADSHHIPFQGT